MPVLTPRLSAYWVNIMTPVPAGIAFPLIEGMKSEMTCEDNRIRGVIPFARWGSMTRFRWRSIMSAAMR